MAVCAGWRRNLKTRTCVHEIHENHEKMLGFYFVFFVDIALRFSIQTKQLEHSGSLIQCFLILRCGV